MADDSLRERGNSLEEEFFRKQNAELVERMRSSQAESELRKQMVAVAEVDDPVLIEQLLEHGVTPATFAALALAPLVAVAWADGRLEDNERKAIIDEATSSGLQRGSAEHTLLEDWLQQQPPASLMTTWAGYAGALAQSLEAPQRQEFRDAMLRRATTVANAAGGFAGRGKMSQEERRVLDSIESALSGRT